MTLSVSLQHAFPGVSLDVRFDAPQGVTALFGRSGSGKTTVVNAVAGLLRPDQGRITLGDRVLFDAAQRQNLAPHRRRIGYVFQDARLFPHLSVRQNLLYGRWFAPKAARRAEFDRVIEMLGIAALLDRRPGLLSGGEKSRVALGRALLSEPDLLLMDEPLAALDEARKAEILPYLERLRDTFALPILYVSHSPAEVARLATTVVMLEAGQVTIAGPAHEVLADPTGARGFGQREAGALITARVSDRQEDGLTRLDCGAGPLWLPGITAPAGAALRLQILARDVMLARTRPEGISALNILEAEIQDIVAADGDGSAVLVRLQLAPGAGDKTAPEILLARITRRSVSALSLAPGLRVFAVIKSVAVAPGAVGPQAI
ncbi:molybdenum ABC transporter ATP-binding protein [Xinfangfangia sp. D13-10-4-6]|uniref:molybdenum ABC transporter ATP-binding protein n=1 Tax=Pseudogemmobacter hezensis TaxID=2737662 RepID=UPI001551B897|nr:molybdenum ABC transporter ATP-binding protein [Pseudogemmobacter hezensis]NPD13994.1 molybdenum ABC transporter ATP-binding protein [Pseudogemmobacter hezensis]